MFKIEELDITATEVLWQFMGIAVRINICTSHEIAQFVFDTYFENLSLDPSKIYKPAAGKAHSQTMIEGGGFHLMVSDQYCVEIDALDMDGIDDPDAKIHRTAEIIHEYLNNPEYHVDTEALEKNREAFSISFTADIPGMVFEKDDYTYKLKVPFGVPFHITVKALMLSSIIFP